MEMEQLEEVLRNVAAEVIGAIGVASGIVGSMIAIGLWAWYWWTTHQVRQPAHRKHH